ncbi:MAG TPA: hypothetical protein PLG73_09610, partial [Candidatus Sumerlaeota bacterium]|nr:hypothetical protein [Candidatus Sumerlaeota bacterium]
MTRSLFVSIFVHCLLVVGLLVLSRLAPPVERMESLTVELISAMPLPAEPLPVATPEPDIEPTPEPTPRPTP